MKLTRLHLLLILAVLVGGGYGAYVWWQGHAQTLATAPVESAPPAPNTSGSLLPPNPAPISTRIAPVPKISKKARAQIPVASSSDGSYTVVKGDTLWRIAEVKSPVHQGPGWVTIWQANKATVKNFDRLEVGWNLTIPAMPQAYVMPYWKPRNLAQAPRAASNVIVDLRQLPTGAESVLVDLKQLPSAAESVLVDLRQLPAGAEFALAQAPKDFSVNLNELPAAPEMALASSVTDAFTASAFRRPVEGYFGQPNYR